MTIGRVRWLPASSDRPAPTRWRTTADSASRQSGMGKPAAASLRFDRAQKRKVPTEEIEITAAATPAPEPSAARRAAEEELQERRERIAEACEAAGLPGMRPPDPGFVALAHAWVAGGPLGFSQTIAVGSTGVWLADPFHEQVVRIDPKTRRVTARIPAGAVTTLAVTGDAVWGLSSMGLVRVDPARDTLLVSNTPIDYLDFASPVSGLGSKMGIDATNKWPQETDRKWGTPIRMSEEVRRRVDALWSSLGLGQMRSS